jgi:hypothetical protein
VVSGQVEYGSTALSRQVQAARIAARDKTGNYAAARLEDDSVLIGRSSRVMHAEEDVLQQAGDRRIVELYTEREPCARKCAGLTQDIPTSYTWQWNNVDRAAVTTAIRTAVRGLFAF